MGKLFAKHFIKNYEMTDDPAVRQSYGKMAGIVGIASNVVLCVMKIAIGIISSSISIIADGINNLADASSSVITLIGFKLAAQPEDEDHPYGHARIEYLTGLLISVIIIIVGISLLKSSIDKIRVPSEPDFSTVTIVVLVIAIGIKLWQTFFNVGVGKAIDSLALKATATDSRNDVISTTCVLIGVIVSQTTGLIIDGWLGVLVALFIVWSGVQLIRETTSPLLGEAPDEELVRDIARIAEEHDKVLGIHDLVVHNYGPGKVFASMHIEVDAKGDIMESHDMIDLIEREIMDKLQIEFTAHMDPVFTDDPIVNQMAEIVKDAIEPLDDIVNMHDLRVVPGPSHTNIIFDLVLRAGCKLKEKEIQEIIDKRVKAVDPNYFIVITFDKAYTKLHD